MFSSTRVVVRGAALLLLAAATPTVASGVTASAAPASGLVVTDAEVGSSAQAAAGSCWEVKQRRPSAPSGAYWLLTPAMAAPAQFYCDQETDGGGWVLVGKGRDGWTTEYAGKGSAASLRTPDTVPMSAVTHQLPSTTVDQLLDGGRVDGLAEGVRIRRAADRDGSSWQEVRLRFAAKSRWTWTFGAEHGVSSWQFDALPGWGGTSESFGTGQSLTRMVTSTGSAKNFRLGFGYGSNVAGHTDAQSHLWSATEGGGGALPYAQVYLRPRVTSTDAGFRAIDDAGAPARPTRPTLDSDALVTPWGVNGLAGSTASEGNVEVQAFTESRGRMYVGGNFRWVQRDAAGAGRVEQPFLAAFDLATGEWDPTFRPVLDEQVRALATLPDGSVVAAGAFSSANGRPATAIVALDPVTGATRESWNLKVENRTTAGVLNIRALEVVGDKLHLGGSFTHLSGGTAPNTVVYTRNAGRVDLATATPDRAWNPDLNGTVIDLDGSDDGERVYAAGHFSTSKGTDAFRAAALLSTAGAPLATPAWTPTWSSRGATYQQAIQQVGNRVYSGGSEHALFGFDTTSFARLSGSITKTGGDFQAADSDGELLYAGCHCSHWTYSGAYSWPNLGTGWTQADAIKWLGVWDAATGAYVPDFVPNLAMRLGSGPWAIKVDSLGRVWVGGDITTVRTSQGQRFSGGFARFQRADSTAPAAPTGLRVVSETAQTVTLGWEATADPSGLTYQVLLGDRPVAVTAASTTRATVPRVAEGRYFVRATDGRGNVGASSPVLALGAGPADEPPTAAFSATVEGRGVTLDGSASSDDTGVVTWQWELGDGTTLTGRSVQHTYAASGTYTVRLAVTDATGRTASTTRQVQVEGTTSTEVIPAGAQWRWYYRGAAPPTSWKDRGFDDTAWGGAPAPLGWGADVVVTSLDLFADPADRPVTAYFRRTFEVDDPTRVVQLRVEAVADDGAVVHVNGVEVGRQNMRDGVVTHTTYAPTARRHAVASAAPLVVEVPASLLVAGTNVVAVDTHVNYRRTPDLTFDLTATVVTR